MDMGMRMTVGLLILGVALAMLPTGCRKQASWSNPELVRMALAAADRGEWKAARAYSYQAVQQNPEDVNALVALAQMLEQHGQVDQALAQLSKAVELDPGHFAAQYNRGRILFEHDHLQDCPAPLEKALALQPGHPETLMLLARSYAAMGNHRDAIRRYAALARDPHFASGGEVFNEIGVLYLAMGDTARAAQSLAIASRKAPESPTIAYNLAVLCDAHLGRPAHAVKFYQDYLRLTEGNVALANRREQVRRHLARIGGD